MNLTALSDLKIYGDSLAVAYQERANAKISRMEAEQKNNERKYQIYDEVVAEGTFKTATDREYQAKNRLTQDKTTYTLLDWEKKVLQTEADVAALEIKFKCMRTIIESDRPRED